MEFILFFGMLSVKGVQRERTSWSG